jgi:hypothetical protein
MDTLCVPVKHEDIEIRKKAIDDMASIYAGARIVQVFDSGLMNLFGRSNFVLPITSSVWMCRSWTLQEGILAPKCVFKFADGYVFATRNRLEWKPIPKKLDNPILQVSFQLSTDSNGQVMHREQDHNIKQSVEEKLSLHLVENVFNIRVQPREYFGDLLPGSALAEAFRATWNALAGRSTTKAEDIYIILANILDFHYDSLRTGLPKERIHSIIFSLGRLPFALFFHVNPSDAMNRPFLNRWLPDSLGQCILTGNMTVQISEKSLKIIKSEEELKSLSYYHFPGIIQPSIRNYWLHNKELTFGGCFHTLNDRDDNFDTSTFESTVIIVENQIPRATRFFNAAVFYAVSSQRQNFVEDEKPANYSLVFCCSARARRLTEMEMKKLKSRDVSQKVFSVSPIDREASVEIMYGMYG